jgi:hypothetical protein
MSRFVNKHALTFALLLVLQIPVPAAYAQVPPTKIQLKQKLKQLWESMDSLEFHCDEMNVDDNDRPKLEMGYSRFEYTIRSNGARIARIKAIRPENEEVVFDVRSDGKRTYSVKWDSETPVRPSQIVMYNQIDTHNWCQGVMCTPLTLLTPLGKPLYSYLDVDDTEIVSEAGVVSVVFLGRLSKLVRCELDSAHDWLPRKMIFDDYCETTVDRFALQDGRWFPVKGRTKFLKSPFQKASFEVNNLHFNRVIADSVFNPVQSARDGTEFTDATTPNRFTRLIGKPKSRSAIKSKDQAKTSKSIPALTATTEPPASPLRAIFVTLSVVALFSGLGIKILKWKR